MDGFNPYREWLGLGVTAPNYYELLGLTLQEPDQRTIAEAAERAMTRVRSFRPGPQAREWASLLDEIRAAKECLTEAQLRARYDSELKSAASAEPILPPESLPSEYNAAAAAPVGALNSVSDLFPPTAGRSRAPLPITAAPSPQLRETVVTPNAAPTWSAGPSPIYDGAGYGQSAYAPLPASSPTSLPMPLMPAAMPVANEPGIVATTSGPRRATFRAAVSSPQKSAPARARGFAWGTVMAIVVLVLAAAGLTFRLSVVARQRELAEAAKAEAAAKEVAIQLPAKKQGQVSGANKQNDAAPESLAAPQITSPEIQAASSREAAADPAASDSREPRPTETAAAHIESEPVSKLTRSQIEPLVKSLQAARAAIVLQDFRAADSQLTKAASLAQSKSCQDMASRLKQVSNYVKQFRAALAAAVADMHGAETFQVGSTQVSFVEAKPDAVILRTAGKNETYRFNDMPPGLAVVIADRKLAANDPMSRVIKGAYLLVSKRADSQTRAKAEALWNEAQAGGATVSHLLPFLNDDYATLLASAPE
jgi:hypothetical protein